MIVNGKSNYSLNKYEMKRLIIGIDPGKQTGVFYSIDGILTQCDTFDFYGCIQRLNQIKEWPEYTVKKVVVEDPNLNKPVFLDKNTTNQIFYGKTTEEKNSALRMGLKRAQNVGQNKQIASLLIEFAGKMGFKVETVRPKLKKLDAEQFKRLSGYKGQTNQHVRDAGVLILGL